MPSHVQMVALASFMCSMVLSFPHAIRMTRLHLGHFEQIPCRLAFIVYM